jgi:photosystem II stability/assembly factor-like uncharacterized protein
MAKYFLVLLVMPALFFMNVGCSTNATEAGNKDGAGQWEILNQSPARSVVSIPLQLIFFDEANGIASQMSALEATANGGRDWQDFYEFDKQAVFSLTFTKGEVGWIVGQDNGKGAPFVQNSKDRGRSWMAVVVDPGHPSTSSRYKMFYDICFTSPVKAWIAGDAGILEAAIDGQRMRIVSDLQTDEEVLNIDCRQSGEVWAAGRGGFVYRFRNRWNTKQIDGSHLFLNVILAGNDIWLLGFKSLGKTDAISGVLLRSRDGVSWEDKTPQTIRSFNDLDLRSGKGWLVGSDGKIFYTIDSGDSWKEVASPTKNDLENIFTLNEQNVWIGGAYHTILKYRPSARQPNSML